MENQLEEEKTNKEIDNEELKQRLSLIEGIINYGVDSNTQNDSYNNPGNKCLLIDLVASTYPNISQKRDTNFLQSGNVAAAMLEIDRKDFAPTNPYQNRPQSINYNVTISAPHMHALALEYLAPYWKCLFNLCFICFNKLSRHCYRSWAYWAINKFWNK